MNPKFKELDELHSWLRENQAKGSDEEYKEKLKRMRELTDEIYEIRRFAR